ncbi:MAG: DUF11 domain-containing protein, partial [Propionibacteriaceae bacterium]|nr:DUF11 domain-containing protein [Propionibacteriaceae bacterium]
LAPGESATATATYTLTQADIDAGGIHNRASATARDPRGRPVAKESEDGDGGDGGETDVPVTPEPGLTLVKSALFKGQPVAGATLVAGEDITYTFAVTNTGNVSLTDITIHDGPFSGTGPKPVPVCPATVVAPGDTMTCTAAYTLTQADVDAGGVTNSATAAGTPPGGDPVESEEDESVLPVAETPSLDLVKTGRLAPNAKGEAGDVVTFTFTVTNTGPVTLSGVTISDPFPGLSALAYDWPGLDGVLAPGESATATATYALTQADIDAGGIHNRASATAKDPKGKPVTKESDDGSDDGGDGGETDVPVTPAPRLTVAKTAWYDGAPVTAASLVAGHDITYRFVVTNTGNVTLTAVTVTEGTFSGTGPKPVPVCPATVVTPGNTMTCTAAYTLTQADVDAGGVTNTATAAGTPPGGDPVESEEDESVLPVADTPALDLVKTGKLAPDAKGVAGDVVTFTFTVTNTGPVTLSDVTISDPFPGLSALTYGWPGADGVLAPGESATATATYALTQADIDAGGIHNKASATAKDPKGKSVTEESRDGSGGGDDGGGDTKVDVAVEPGFSLTATGTLADPQPDAGDQVTVSFVITNTGNATMSGVAITDTLPGLTAITYVWPGKTGVLAPGESATATGTYTLTQADVDAGVLADTATVTGTTPARPGVKAGDPATPGQPASANTTMAVELPGVPQLTVVTKGTPPPPGAKAGDPVTVTYTVTNTGNVTLDGVGIDDPQLRPDDITYTWPGEPGVLKPGEVMIAVATYRLAQADVDAGGITTTATVTSATPDGTQTPVGVPATTVDVAAASALRLTGAGTLAPGAQGQAGDEVTFTYSVTNTGTTTVTRATISDPLAGPDGISFTWPGAAGVLAPGQTVTGTTTYRLTQADVDAGGVTALVTAIGVAPDTLLTRTATVPVPVAARPSVEFTETSSHTGDGHAGDKVTYTFTLTNTGNVTLGGLTITDPRLRDASGASTIVYTWPGAPGQLAPGESATATATYYLTQADVDAGSVPDTASVNGHGPGDTAVTVTTKGSSDVAVAAQPGLTVTKTTSAAEYAVGSTVTYAFTIINTGNVTLSKVAVNDTGFTGTGPLSAVTCTDNVDTVVPGGSRLCQAAYTLTAADLAAGTVTNTATATGVAPGGEALTVESGGSSVTITVRPGPVVTAPTGGQAVAS